MTEAVDHGVPPHPTGPAKIKRNARSKASLALAHLTQHLAQAGTTLAASDDAAHDAIPSYRIGLAMNSLELPVARDRRPPVMCGYAIRYEDKQP